MERGNMVNAEIPDSVVAAVNKLLIDKYAPVIRLTQREIMEEIYNQSDTTKDRLTFYAEMLRMGYLDIEPLYRKHGWIVEYDFVEEPLFIFKCII